MYRSDIAPCRLALGGDAMISRRMSLFQEPEFLGLVELLHDVDLAIVNAEMLFHDFENPPAMTPGGTYMRAAPHIVEELRFLGVGVVAAANNHAYDFGEGGVVTNIANLNRYGMPHAGTGRNLGDAVAPAYLDTPTGRVALVSATTSGPSVMRAQHRWRDGHGRPGANLIRYTTTYTVTPEVFTALRRFRDDFGLKGLFAAPGSTARDPLTAHPPFMDQSWGLSTEQDSESEFYMADLQSVWQYPAPDGNRFRVGDSPGIALIPHEGDLAENQQRIHDAKRQADLVVFSVHSHEDGATHDEPSDLLVAVAHAAIDAGADVVHGHGPHCDRGIEIYKGKPIFYSIGHFVIQNDTIERVPLDNMIRSRFENPWVATPADFFDTRAGRELTEGRRGFAADPPFWRDVVAIVEFTAGRLSDIQLRPIDLGFGRPRGQRGRPVLATGDNAHEVLDLFRRLSEPFGTVIEENGNLAQVKLSGD